MKKYWFFFARVVRLYMEKMLLLFGDKNRGINEVGNAVKALLSRVIFTCQIIVAKKSYIFGELSFNAFPQYFAVVRCPCRQYKFSPWVYHGV